MIQLILAQILVCIVQYYIATTENIKRIYWVTFFFNLANMLCYLLNKDYVTVFVYILICIRTFVYIFRDSLKKYKWSVMIPIGFIVLQLIVGFLTMKSNYQLISVFTAAFTCYYMWFFTTTQQLRVGNIIGNSSWCVYNTITGLYIVAIGRLITVIMNSISYLRKQREDRENG